MTPPTRRSGRAALDKLVHVPARLAITTAPFACDSADVRFLQRLTGLRLDGLRRRSRVWRRGR